jgi:hypothetical protein
MKIIKVLLLFTFALWSDFKLDIPHSINIVSLENIVDNGWNESSKTLNVLIVDSVERLMPKILEKIQKPVFKVEPTAKDKYPIVSLLLTKDDYLLIVSYIKYLEYNKNYEESNNLYIKLVEGLANIDDPSVLSTIVSMTIGNIIANGLIEGIDKNHYSKTMQNSLNKNIESLLIIDYKKYYISMEYEKNYHYKWQEKFYLKNLMMIMMHI